MDTKHIPVIDPGTPDSTPRSAGSPRSTGSPRSSTSPGSLGERVTGLGDTAAHGLRPRLLVVFAGLLAVLVVVVFALPRWVSHSPEPQLSDGQALTNPNEPSAIANPSPDKGVASPPVTPPSASSSVADSQAEAQKQEAQKQEAQKQEAQSMLGLALREQAVLESERAVLWGGEDYGAALASVAQGDARFAEQRYAEALDAYRLAYTRLTELAQSKEVRLASTLAAAEAAYVQGDSAVSAEHYGVALAISPNHPRATLGLERARKLDQVLGEMAAVTELRTRGELEEAKTRLAGIRELDPQYEPAAAALAEVEAALRAREFDVAMSKALTALDAGRLSEASQHLAQARALQPDSPAVRDVSARVVKRGVARRVRALTTKAKGAEQAERWDAAADLYAQIRAVDPTAEFAGASEAQARTMAELHRSVDGYLNAPTRLYSAQPLGNARALLENVSLLVDPGPSLDAKRLRLEALVELASRPMPVTLLSDATTEVSVYKVGRLGRFERKELSLTPGRYTIVGRCAGFRDVRLELWVKPEMAPDPLRVQCIERI